MLDFNCDMGEEMPMEKEIFPFIHSANISCGLHAGNEKTIRETIQLAIQYGVNIGAHFSFNDREHFGRKEIYLSYSELYLLITQQLSWMKHIAETEGAKITHVKPHGALYNISAKDEQYAACIADAVKDFNPTYILYGLSGSTSIKAAKEKGLQIKNEVFADRTYNASGQLTARSEPNALITTEEKLIEQVTQLLEHKTITAVNGNIIAVEAETLCLHSDGEKAATFAAIIHQLILHYKK